MNLATTDIRNAIVSLQPENQRVEASLNAADAKLGDGDTGTMIARLLQEFADVEATNDMTVGAYFTAIAMAGAKSTGSSLGTLIVGALMAVGTCTRDRHVINSTEIADLIEIARTTVQNLGNAQPGDKTIIDSLNHIETALRTEDGQRRPLKTAHDAAVIALDTFRSQPNRIGRARIFEEKSRGLDDPGMLAVALLLRALSDAATDRAEKTARSR